MANENVKVECSVDVTIDNEVKNIKIRHNSDVCEARIRIDDRTVEANSKKLSDGGALFFEYGQSKIVVTIRNIKGEYSYDCFVNGISVKDDMPWKLGKYELPDVLKWQDISKKGMKYYIITEAIKGAIVGCSIFIMLCLFKLVMPEFLQGINLPIYMVISIVPLPILYAILSPREFKAGMESIDLYKSYRSEEVEETAAEKEETPQQNARTEDYFFDIDEDSK